MPISLQYQKGRHLLEAGAGLNYLTGTRADLILNQYLFPWERTDLENAFTRSTEESVTLSGSRFQRVYPSIQLAYHFQLTTRWQIGLQARWVPGGSSPEAGSNHFRLGMRYYFLKW